MASLLYHRLVSKHNANGLWEHSPLLCAAGLVEGLILVQRVAMNLWDKIPEPTLALHLHNMLVKKGYLEKVVGLYATPEDLFQDSIFPKGIPSNGFSEALVTQVGQRWNDHVTLRQREALSRDPTKDIHHLLDANFNRFFRTKSTLMMYHDAGWVPEKISDSPVKIPSLLYMVRLMSTTRLIDAETGETKLEETELVRRAKPLGKIDAQLQKLASVALSNIGLEDTDNAALLNDIAELRSQAGRITEPVPGFAATKNPSSFKDEPLWMYFDSTCSPMSVVTIPYPV